jgi:hypothetical protein
MGGALGCADDWRMASTHHISARFLIATAALTGLALTTVGCSSSTPKASSAATTATTVAAPKDPNGSAFCQTARRWMVHEFNGEGEAFAADPVAFKKYWTEYAAFLAASERQAPAEISANFPVGYEVVQQFTPILAKYDYNIERIKAEGTPAELAVGQRMDAGPNPKEQAAQDAVLAYEGRVCQTAQPPAADVTFTNATPNKAYCEAARAADEAVGKHIIAKKWSVDAVRTFVTSDDYTTMYDNVRANAPAEIKADVEADADWSTNQQVDVLEKYGYDARKLFLDGTAADRAILQKSAPAIAGHYARAVAYEEQVCGAK